MTRLDHHRGENSETRATSGETGESLITVLVHTTKKFSSVVAECLAEQNLTLDEWMVLDTIARNNGASMSLISSASGCAGASLTRTVDKLVMNALVYREASASDRRKVEVFISQRGKDTRQSIQAHLQQLEGAVASLVEEAGVPASSLTHILMELREMTLASFTPVD